MKRIFLSFFILSVGIANAQMGYWQQELNYEINVDLDDKKHILDGDLELLYTNNSPDLLSEVFFNLYWNAFQHGSMLSNMANIPTRFKDKAIGQNIENYKDDEWGEQIIEKITMNDKVVSFYIDQTILHGKLPNNIKPGETVIFKIKYTTRIPKLVERAGRDGPEGVAYTFTQWYPKICVFDKDGWHPDIYVAREFYGDYGSFNVNITANKNYLIGGTGVLLNSEEIGHGYNDKKITHKKGTRLTWNFKAEKVHDFAWVADKDFVHEKRETPTGIVLHFIYKKDKKSSKHIGKEKFKDDMLSYFKFMQPRFGTYEWPQFTIIQGGEGAMEYPMATVMQVRSDSYEGLLGTAVHEASHMWYYGMLGTDEQQYSWMDEGFTSFAEDEAMNVLTGKNIFNPHSIYLSRFSKVASVPWIEPTSTLANYFDGKFPYQMAAYMKGSLFLVQLRGIIGENAFWSTLARYKKDWAFKHPTPKDFLRIAEKESGMILDWYLNLWISTNKYPDLAIDSIYSTDKNLTSISLKRIGSMPMPVDIRITLKSGEELDYTIPLSSMFGHKKDFILLGPWNYTQKERIFVLDIPLKDIDQVHLDPESWTADINRDDNVWEVKI
ncbi:MAG: Aminopeptidase N [Owenweeksia sp. TMED14]|nr:MAG: Aminopeptidase N [Owenweeksia sp. TMED14]|tara:strand:- start:1626 stop:3449 length:1824 start_codon:yes stop_codon:yes gene_type:complete